MSDHSIAVIIPCFNQSSFVAAAIESALLQSRPPDAVIVINDGSTDQAGEVLATMDGITVLTQDNRGLSAARNAGLEHCDCDYVTFLDADDLLLPGALQAGADCLAANPDCAFVWGKYQARNLKTGHVTSGSSTFAAGDTYAAMLRSNFIAMHGTVMYRRQMLASVSGFDQSLQACEDYDLYLRLTRRFPVAHHEHLTAEYTRHPDSMSGKSTLMLETVLTVLRAQHHHVADRSDYAAAYRDGVNFWTRFYGRRSLMRIVRLLVELRIREARAESNRLRGTVDLGKLLATMPAWFADVWRERFARTPLMGNKPS
jgi:glycosyltransferase involved in cell wall biosynthesis